MTIPKRNWVLWVKEEGVWRPVVNIIKRGGNSAKSWADYFLFHVKEGDKRDGRVRPSMILPVGRKPK